MHISFKDLFILERRIRRIGFAFWCLQSIFIFFWPLWAFLFPYLLKGKQGWPMCLIKLFWEINNTKRKCFANHKALYRKKHVILVEKMGIFTFSLKNFILETRFVLAFHPLLYTRPVHTPMLAHVHAHTQEILFIFEVYLLLAVNWIWFNGINTYS